MKRLFLPVSLVLLFAGVSHGDEATDKAKAALALAKAQREREATKQSTAKPMPKAIVMEEGECFTDLGTARIVAKKVGKPLILWVGMTCHDAPDVCRSLRNDAVSCHVESYHGSTTPRLVVPDGDTGTEYKILKSEMDTTSPIGVRKRMGLPVKEPGVIIESVGPRFMPSYVPMFATPSFAGANCAT